MVKSNYTAWSVLAKEYSADWPNIQKLQFFARYAVLAPSGHNTQPWKLRSKGSSLILSVNRDHYLPIDGSGLQSVEPYVSLGSFIEVFVLAARGFGYELSVEAFVSDDNVAELSIGKKLPAEPKLLDAITNRVSNRNHYQQKQLDKNVVTDFLGTEFSGVNTVVVNKADDISYIAGQTELAISSIMSNPVYRRELSNWVRINQTHKFDGMPGFTHGFGSLKSFVSKIAVRYAPGGGPQAVKSAELIRQSGALIIVCIENNKTQSFINSGRVYSRICVDAQAAGLATSALGASVLDGVTRDNIKKYFKISSRPVYLLRLGKATVKATHSPRWPANKVIVEV